MASCQASSSNVVESPPLDGVKTLCEDSVYLFHEPLERKPEVEIVFIHGLQLGGDFEKAYLTTWLARGGAGSNCWPKTWLAGKFPNARILSLSYDVSALKTATQGRMDSYLLGEKLVQEMVMDGVSIGQHGCPVVFVCHCLGGLIAKQIVVSGHRMSSQDGRIGQLLCNVEAFFFYATPHRGSGVANLAKYIPFIRTSPLVDDLEIMNKNTTRLDEEFQSLNQKLSNQKWKFYVIGETHATKYMHGLYNIVFVDEASARYGHKYMAVQANHFDVCKPKSEVETSYRYLVECIKEVVKEDIGSLLALPEFMVEMEERMQKLQSMLEENPIVGLVGMGGIGKTTLSKHFYNQEQKHFQKFCFLEDVLFSGNIRSFQKQLYCSLCGLEWDEGKKVEILLKEIRDCIMKLKVLVVVDNVGRLENLEALQVVAFKDGRSGSKMIVTTRKWGNLPEYVIPSGIMEVNVMGEGEALKLFSHYAFHDVESEVKIQLGAKAVEIVKACGGLPLSLEVIGQYLRRVNKVQKSAVNRLKDWDDTLRKLKAAEPIGGTLDDERLWSILRISYDDLPKKEKSLFLDFACILYRNPNEDLIVRILDSSLELQNLKDCSLIKLGEDKRSLVMHDQLQDMGKKIVEENADGDHWYNMSRLWSWEKLKILEIEGEHKNFEQLEGVVREVNNEYVSISHDGWKRCKYLFRWNMNLKGFSRMRLLNLEGSELHVVKFYMCMCSEELRWLCISKTNVTNRSLQVLQTLKGLRVLHMSNCQKLRMLPTCTGNLSYLVDLDLSYCHYLCGLPKTIGNLKLLQKLDLSCCGSLKTLPDSIGDLSGLVELHLDRCGNLHNLPKTIGNLKLLQKLDFSWCLSLKTLPDSIGDLSGLVELDFVSCKSLHNLPETSGKLKFLQKLDLSWNKSLETLPYSIGDLLSLVELHLHDCGNLHNLPETIGNLKFLQKLDLSWNKSLETLPYSIGDLLSLVELHLHDCGNLHNLPETIGNLKVLQKLDLSYCKSLETLRDSIGDLSSLMELHLRWCESLHNLPETIGNLKFLPKLDLSYCKSLETLPNSIGDLSGLVKLHLHDCRNLQNLPETIGNLKLLQKLDLSYCKSLETLPDSIGDLSGLVEVDLYGCETLHNLPETVGNLKLLQKLKLPCCGNLKTLPNSIGDLSGLVELHLYDCGNLNNLPETIGNLKVLQKLDLSYCKSLETLPDSIGDLSGLVELHLCRCESLQNLPETIGNLKFLQKLDLTYCKSLETLPDCIGDLSSLVELHLHWCESLDNLPETIANLKFLQKLDFF